jgi:ferredoxin-NADP reductase
VYMCGPPPMIDAVIDLAVDKHGLDEDRIFHDKFTTSADAADVADDPLFGRGVRG